MIDGSALLALKNAWNGAVATADRVRDLAPQLSATADSADLNAPDLETYHEVALAHAIAAQALRGLIEELRRKTAAG